MLSTRGQSNANQLDIPWRFAKSSTYDPETNPDGLISFATAENMLMAKELEEFANKVHLPAAAFRYAYSTAGGETLLVRIVCVSGQALTLYQRLLGPRLPSAFATHVNEYFNPHISVTDADVKITAAATALHDILAYSLCAPGEGILTTRPYYGRFEIDFGNKAGIKLVAADTDHETCFDETVVDALERKLLESNRDGVTIKAVLIVNPHNPLGRCYPRVTLLAIMSFCSRYNLHLISDEIYALSVFPNPAHSGSTTLTSLLSINTDNIIDPKLVHVTYGLSKDFGSAGLKIGALVTRNEHLKKAVHAVLRFSGVSGPSVAIATAMLEDRAWCREFIDTSRRRIGDAYAFTTKRLGELGIEYYTGGNAGFFFWIDLSRWLPPDDGKRVFERECMLAHKFLGGGVFLQPGEEHSVRPGWFRMVFTMDKGVVEEGLNRVGEVLRGLQW